VTSRSFPLPVLLAPVPAAHLIDGKDVCSAEGQVAFGSRAFDVFQELDALRQGVPIEAFMYASHQPERIGGAKVSWRARYVGSASALGDGSHPEGHRYRPPSTWPEDGMKYWWLFWHVTDLRELEPSEQIWTHHFRERRTGKMAPEPYAPEGPMLKFFP
jgi:hypothetical protein